jgi:hypothetical protein
LVASHTSAEPDRTSATALPTSIGAWLTNAKSNVPSTYWASSGGTANGAIAEASLAVTSASDTPSTLPAPQLTTQPPRP